MPVLKVWMYPYCNRVLRTADFNLLNEGSFILIVPFDIFGRGFTATHTFEGVCRECPDLRLNDGSLRMFINTIGQLHLSSGKELIKHYIFVLLAESSEEALKKRLSCGQIQRNHHFLSHFHSDSLLNQDFFLT